MRENKINILLPLLRLPADEGHKSRNTINFINSNAELLNTYTKNHLVPLGEELTSERGYGKTSVVEVDGVKYTYLICADYTSNKYAYNAREAEAWKTYYIRSYGQLVSVYMCCIFSNCGTQRLCDKLKKINIIGGYNYEYL